ncbi:hypothetical protein Ahy_B03g063587 [Arachis hypogaea]|uniref:DNA/RNA-binding protein Alba-like domain-containing protein n=1 Tax=Arachis hypogaea TaxID=3818 RepID=A0A444ZXJ5_ARAHY|nr:hypothetical protein Ahy_B03g063587 [Arachis hypogaea]
MDRYQRVEKPKTESPINDNDIRITTQGRMRNYITYATTLLQTTRHVSMITVTLSRKELDTSSTGYQPLLPADQVKPLNEYDEEGEGSPRVRGRGCGGREGEGEEEGVEEITMEVWNTVMVGMVAEDEAVVYEKEAEALWKVSRDVDKEGEEAGDMVAINYRTDGAGRGGAA